MSASPGNNHWRLRRSHGRPARFKQPEDLWLQCMDYFEWVDEHPLLVPTLTRWRGVRSVVVVPRQRPMTLKGLCIHLGISFQTWLNYKSREDFFYIVTRAEGIIWDQQFCGAAVGLFNPRIIWRSLARKRPG